MSAITTPVWSKSTWATNTCSPSADGIWESQVTRARPFSRAALAAGTIWSPELFESMTPSWPWVVAVVTISICPATLFSGVGPMNSRVPGFPSSSCASRAPWWAWSNTRMPMNFGTSTRLASFPFSAMTSAWAGPAARAATTADRVSSLLNFTYFS